MDLRAAIDLAAIDLAVTDHRQGFGDYDSTPAELVSAIVDGRMVTREDVDHWIHTETIDGAVADACLTVLDATNDQLRAALAAPA